MTDDLANEGRGLGIVSTTLLIGILGALERKGFFTSAEIKALLEDALGSLENSAPDDPATRIARSWLDGVAAAYSSTRSPGPLP